MEVNKAILRFKDGSVKKGKTSDFFPNKNQFHLELFNGEIVNIEVEDLKALFFVRDFDGNKDRKDRYNDVIPAGGRKMEVEFFDGEKMTGYSQGYSRDRRGFFLIPADKQGNNERIFVVMTATAKITFL